MRGFKRFIVAMSTEEAGKNIFPICVAYIVITLLIIMGWLDTIVGLALYVIVTILVIVTVVIVARNIMRKM